jgi:signal transduction histidine kinase
MSDPSPASPIPIRAAFGSPHVGVTLLPWTALPLGAFGGWLLAHEEPGGILLLLAGAAALIAGLLRQRHLVKAVAESRFAADTRLRRRDSELNWMRKVATTMVSGDELDHVLQVVADAVADLLDSKSAGIGFVVEEGRFVRVVAGSGQFKLARDQLLPVDHSLMGSVVTSERSITVDDMSADPRNFAIPGVTPSVAFACVPLTSAGLVIGVMAACDRKDGRPFNETDLHVLQALGDQVVVGLDRAHVLAESRRKEESLATKNRELQRATELKSQFLANMSHELRTPLNAINGFSDLLLTEELGELNESQKEFLDSILRNGKHLLGLINAILDLSKIEAGRMTLSLAQTDVREAITGAVTDTAPLRSTKQQECIMEIGTDPLPVLADGVRIRQILFNLLSNASKFTPESGTVTISAVATRAPLPVPGERAGEKPRFVSRDCVWISVRDTGTGIKTEDMSKLFAEFSQVDSSASRQQQGTGLGLVLSKRFVEMHGGSIGCESIYGAGATFWFILPTEGPIRKPGATGEMATI